MAGNDHIKEMKYDLSRAYGTNTHECIYCGCDIDVFDLNYTIDHLVPQAKGGISYKLNMRPACRACNGDKGCKSLPEYREHVYRLFVTGGSNSPELFYKMMRIDIMIRYTERMGKRLVNQQKLKLLKRKGHA